MSNTKNKLKYSLKTYVTLELRDVIIKELGISKKTYYNKLNARIGETQGFEHCELILIASILDVEINNLITPEAMLHYVINKSNNYVEA
mgnify:CR=1 FL=1